MIDDDLDIPGLMARVAARDPAAADEVEMLADRLRALAVELRRGGGGDPGLLTPSGMADRVRMRVVGPDGEVKQAIDTGAQQ